MCFHFFIFTRLQGIFRGPFFSRRLFALCKHPVVVAFSRGCLWILFFLVACEDQSVGERTKSVAGRPREELRFFSSAIDQFYSVAVNGI